MTTQETVDPTPAGGFAEPPPKHSEARPPRGTGTTPLWGQLIALALIALGVVACRDALAAGDLIDGTVWTDHALQEADGIQARDWMLVVFAAIAVIGLLLVIVATKPRPHKVVRLTADTGAYLRSRDLAHLAAAVVEDTDGVTDVKATSSRRRLKLRVRTVEHRSANQQLRDRIGQRLADVLAALETPPRTKIRISNDSVTL